MIKRNIMTFALMLFALAGLACQSAQTPSQSLQSLHKAHKNNDSKTARLYFLKKDIEKFEAELKTKNKTFEDYISEISKMLKDAPETIETRNEKIDGDSATVEIKDDPNGNWRTENLVKEDGVWKVDVEPSSSRTKIKIDPAVTTPH